MLSSLTRDDSRTAAMSGQDVDEKYRHAVQEGSVWLEAYHRIAKNGKSPFGIAADSKDAHICMSDVAAAAVLEFSDPISEVLLRYGRASSLPIDNWRRTCWRRMS